MSPRSIPSPDGVGIPLRTAPHPPSAPPYRAPRLTRVRVATARLVVGQVDAQSFCTVHIHDDAGVGKPCQF